MALLIGINKNVGMLELVNDIRFDVPKLKARMIIKGFKPFSSFKQIDTCVIAKKTFGFTSNKLEYMTDKLCTKYKN